jgi:hypothetical protein
MSLQLAVEVLLDQAAGRESANRSQVIAAALALSTATINTGHRNLLDAAGLNLLATARTMELDQTGRDRAMHLANVVLAFDWRQQYGYINKGGVVVVFEGKAQSWVNELRNPEHWQPGCVAVDDTGNAWTAVGGNEQNGAAMWISSCRSSAINRW